MAHEQLGAPLSQIDQDLIDLESFSDEERFSFVREMIIHPMIADEVPQGVGIQRNSPVDMAYGARSIRKYNPEELPADSAQPTQFVLPNVPSPLGGDQRPFNSLRELPRLIDDSYETGEHLIMNVPQCYMIRVPKEKDPYLYVTMTKCSAIVAHTEEHVYMAHIGYSLAHDSTAVMEYLREQGVAAKDIRIIGNINNEVLDPDEEKYRWPQRKDVLGTAEAFVGLGISEANFIGFSDALPDDKGNLITEVIVDKNGIFTDQAYCNLRSLQMASDTQWSQYQSTTL